jgi:FlaA1/EpsC-like NDP-sugar epimerase
MKLWLKRLGPAVMDAAMVLLAGGAAIVLRLDGRVSLGALLAYGRGAVVGAALFVGVFALFGVYRRLWRYASVRDLLAVLVGCGVAGVPLALVPGVPMGLKALHWLLSVGGVTAWRLSGRAWRELTERRSPSAPSRRRVLVAGAGDAGTELVRELARHPDLGLAAVGFVDDSPVKQGQKAYGLPVAGVCAQVGEVARRLCADEVIIAMPSAPSRAVRTVWEAALAAKLPVRILPALKEGGQGQRLMQQVRQVKLEDLLSRPEVTLELDLIHQYISKQVVLITGAGGSIGSELCRQVASMGPGALVLVGHGENSLFDIEMELCSRFPTLQVHAVVGDIQNRRQVERILEAYRPAVIFHAAAHKHVPLMEKNPLEAVKNNIFGTFNVAAAADLYGVERFVMISTDKAVNPRSVMGATKRAAEQIVQALAATSRTVFIAVRFGNVLGSRGSVVPLFQQQIARGGPVTVTHPDATRYFMTIPEAARLVLQAGAMGASGELFLLDMGQPIRVVDLACDLIRLAGLEPGTAVPITYTGLRPGEKVTEELFTAEEAIVRTRHERVFRVRAQGGSGVLSDLAGAMDQFRAMAQGEEEVSPAAIVAVLEQASEGGREADGHDRKLVRESDGGH